MVRRQRTAHFARSTKSCQLNDYHRKAIENAEYREQYDVLLKKVQSTERSEKEASKDDPQQPSNKTWNIDRTSRIFLPIYPTQ